MFAPTNPLGWSPNTPITADQLNDIDSKTVDAVDGVGGGTYAGPLTFSAATIAGTSAINISNNIVTTGLISGGNITAGGNLTLTSPTGGINMSGGNIDTNGGDLRLDGGDLNTGGGSISTSGGDILNVNNIAMTGDLLGVDDIQCQELALTTVSAITYPTTTFTKYHPHTGFSVDQFEIMGAWDNPLPKAHMSGKAVVLRPGLLSFYPDPQPAHAYWVMDWPVGSQVSQVSVALVSGNVSGSYTSLTKVTVMEFDTLGGWAPTRTISVTDTVNDDNNIHWVDVNISPPISVTSAKTIVLEVEGEAGDPALRATAILRIRSTYTRTSVPMGGA